MHQPERGLSCERERRPLLHAVKGGAKVGLKPMELIGIEPTTSRMPFWRSTS